MVPIEIESLSKRFDEVAAIENLTLTVQEGEVFGFLGPNGAGKSTTIDILLDFVRPTEGRVTVLGYNPRTESRAVRDRIGILPEGYSLYDRLSAREHIEFAIEMEESEDNPDAILNRVGLADDATRTVGGFSKGMGQRLALGMALVGDPDLLVLDEPTSGLDPSGAQEMRDIIRQEVDRGATVFFSSHLLDQVEAICDRVGILRDGELIAVDSVEGLHETSNTESSLVLTVDERPDSLDVEAIEGVSGVTADGSTLRISCSEPGVKAAVISRVESSGATVTDITTEETTLEDVFTEYMADEAGQEAEE